MTHGVAMLLTVEDIMEITARIALESLLCKARGEEPDAKVMSETVLNDLRKHATQE